MGHLRFLCIMELQKDHLSITHTKENVKITGFGHFLRILDQEAEIIFLF